MDRVTKFLAYEGRVSLICANTTDMIQKIRDIHDLTPTTTAAMGRFATISGMMGLTEIKEEEDCLTIQLKGNGPMGALIAVVRRVGNTSQIKVCTDNPLVELPLKPNGKIDVGGAVGNQGFLNIIQKNEMTLADYNGLVPLVSGEIAEDFAQYFATSKQKPTVLALGVLVNQTGVKEAGGYMIGLMPDATEEDITNLENAIQNAPSISQMLSENRSLEEIARTITGDENIMILSQPLQMEYVCDCDKEKFERGLISLGKEELQKIINEDGKADIVCHFCKKAYHFSKEELETLLEQLEEK